MTELEAMHRLRPESLAGWSRYFEAVKRDRKKRARKGGR